MAGLYNVTEVSNQLILRTWFKIWWANGVGQKALRAQLGCCASEEETPLRTIAHPPLVQEETQWSALTLA